MNLNFLDQIVPVNTPYEGHTFVGTVYMCTQKKYVVLPVLYRKKTKDIDFYSEECSFIFYKKYKPQLIRRSVLDHQVALENNMKLLPWSFYSFIAVIYVW